MCRDFFELRTRLPSGLFVDAIQRRNAGSFQMSGDGFIRRQHELFDNAMRDVAFGARDPDHLARKSNSMLRFGHIEIDGAALGAFAIENQREFAHQFETAGQMAP